MQLYTDFSPLFKRIAAILPHIKVVNSSSGLKTSEDVTITDPKSALGLLERFDKIKLLVLSDNPNFAEGRILLQKGIKGYGNTYIHALHLMQALAMIKNGQIWLYPQFIQQLIKTMRLSPEKDELLEKLTEREREIALFVSQGLSNKEIAIELNITERTVKAHLSAVFEKVGVHERLKLALMLQ